MVFYALSKNRKIFAVSSLVLNLFASQIGEFFLPYPVVTENSMRESCNDSVGVRQGDVLSVIVLKLVLDCVIKKLDIGGNMSTTILQINVYPVVICRNLKALGGALQALDNTAQEILLIIHQEKTKYIKVISKKHTINIST